MEHEALSLEERACVAVDLGAESVSPLSLRESACVSAIEQCR